MSDENQQVPLSFSVLINRFKAEIQTILSAVHFAGEQNFPIHGEIEERLEKLVKTINVLETLKKQGWELTEKPEGTYRLTSRLSLDLIEYNIVKDAVELNKLRHSSWYAPIYYHCSDTFELKLPCGLDIFLKAQHQPVPSLPFDKLHLVKLKDGFTWLTEETLKRLYQYLNR